MEKLRSKLDAEFEYVNKSLSMAGFRSAVTKFLKGERSHLKAHWKKEGPNRPPVHMNQKQWERLIAYSETVGEVVQDGSSTTWSKNDWTGGLESEIVEPRGGEMCPCSLMIVCFCSSFGVEGLQQLH